VEATVVRAEQLMSLELPEHEFAWTREQCQLYALATGFGRDPTDERELRYVYEGPGFMVSPTAAVTLYFDDRWMQAAGLNVAMVLHGEQRSTFHRPIPPEGRGRVSSQITGVFDKGPERGLLILCEQVLSDAQSRSPIATNVATIFARGDGGSGFSRGPAARPHQIPDRPADVVVKARTRPEQALLYRLCGDRNPLHADPEAARLAGFERPILHGMCTFGFAARAVLGTACGYEARRLASFGARMSAPVFPGDSLRTEIWLDRSVASFRTSVPERGGRVVLDGGRAELAAAD
jgi:acyl dehydratase